MVIAGVTIVVAIVAVVLRQYLKKKSTRGIIICLSIINVMFIFVLFRILRILPSKTGE